MKKKNSRAIFISKTVIFSATAIAASVCVYFFHKELWDASAKAYTFLSDREKIKAWIDGFGNGAPLVFIGLQVLQVIFAPVPGEASGFIGGYLFGAFKGFLFSSVGLTIGSILNFAIGRFLGEHYIRKLIPEASLERLENALRRQGIFIIFMLFVFPGFPKDYFCLFLGISKLPLRVLIILAAVGRMPGTLMLSLQGAFIYQEMYGIFALIMGVFILAAAVTFRYRDAIYKWIEKIG